MRFERAAFVAASFVTTLAGAVGQHRVHAVAKAAMMPALYGSVLRHRDRLSVAGRVELTVATAAALAGDVLLVSPEGGEPEGAARRRLRRGAAAFAVQQVGYVAAMRRSGARPRLRTVAPVVGVLIGLAALDTAKKSAPDPIVTSYGLLLGAMTAHAVESSDPRIRAGGAAFLVSDATILLREQALKGRPAAQAVAGALVMTTYAAAQRLLVDGLLDTDRGPGVQCMAYYVSVLTVPVLL